MTQKVGNTKHFGKTRYILVTETECRSDEDHMELNSPGPDIIHDGLIHQAIFHTNRGRQHKLTETMEGFIDLKRRKKVEQVPLLPVLVQPDFHQELKQEQPFGGVPLKSHKAFQHNGPSVPEQTPPIYHYEHPLKRLGVNLLPDVEELNNASPIPSGTQPMDSFVKGSVKYTTNRGLKKMVTEMKTLTDGTHGCIVNENYQPDADVYVKDIHFIVDQNLGKGSNGKTQLCYDSKSGKTFVRKKIPKSALRTSEILVPMNLDHTNVTKFYGLIQRDKMHGPLQMELMLEYGGTALNHFLLDKTNNFNHAEIWELAGQGLSGLQQMAYFGMIHHDIKPENICITKTNEQITLKITDFGSAKLPQEPISFAGWTPEYMAPECCKLVLKATQGFQNFPVDESSVTSKVDVFGFALVVMYLYKRYHVLQKVITKGKTSYSHINRIELQTLQLQLMIWLATVEDFVENLIPDECDLDMRELLKKMTKHDFNERLDAEKSLQIVQDREKRTKAQRRKQDVFSAHGSTVPKPEENLVPKFIPVQQAKYIPEFALHQMEVESGPIRNKTKDKLRQKLEKSPYSHPGKKGGKAIPSKTIPPQTPVDEMRELSLNHMPNIISCQQKLEETSQVVTQPTQEVGDFIATNGISSVVQMETTLPLSIPEMQYKAKYQALGQVQPVPASDKTSFVPMLVCDEEPTQLCVNYDKKPTGTPGLAQEEEFVTSLAKPDPAKQQQQIEAILKLLAGQLKRPKVNLGSTNKAVHEHPVPEWGPAVIVSINRSRSSSAEPKPNSAQATWGVEVNQNAVGQGNIPNFSFL